MHLAELLASETMLTLMAALVGALWTAFKASDWYAQRREQRVHRALEALEAAVEAVYNEYVRTIKATRSTGGLTDQERQQARTLARDRAVKIARRQGIDLARELGADFIDLWTSRLVHKRKHA
jgi:hypothetical protein